MRRQLLAALALGYMLVANPVQAAAPTDHAASFQVAEDRPTEPKKERKAKKDDASKREAKTEEAPKPSKPDPKKGNVLSNLLGGKVAFNPQTKVYHVKGCRYYDGKSNVMVSLADAKKKGGKPCQVCQRGKK